MLEQELIEKIIAKAVDGGWWYAGNNKEATIEVINTNYFVDKISIFIDYKMGDEPQKISLSDIIFNHQFAKALWGEERFLYIPLNRVIRLQFKDGRYPYFEPEDHTLVLPAWKYHLQNMVVSDNFIQYLSENT